MTTYTERVCAALKGLIESRTEWDEAPGLYFLYAEGPVMRVSTESMVPDYAWQGVPTYVLAGLADLLASGLHGQLLRATAPDNLLGAVFRCEMWGVRVPEDDPAAAEQARTMHRARQLADHPDRVEQRHAWAVLRDGGVYFAVQSRGDTKIRTERQSGIQGLIPDSLARITRAICAEVN